MVHALQHHYAIFICRLDEDFVMVLDVVNGNLFDPGDVGPKIYSNMCTYIYLLDC